MDTEEKQQGKVKLRQDTQKQQILEQLRKVPIVQVCCERVKISRASFYRWTEQDPKFKAEANKAIQDGIAMVNDVAESALLSQIKEGNVTSIIYWLKNNSSRYRDKLEVTAKRNDDEELTPEEQKSVEEALKLAKLACNPKPNGPEKDSQ